jgi:hypothetical protein
MEEEINAVEWCNYLDRDYLKGRDGDENITLKLTPRK